MLKDFIIGIYYKNKLSLSRSRVEIGINFQPFCKFTIEGPGMLVIGNNVQFHGIKSDIHQYITIETLSNDAKIIIGDNCSLCASRIMSKFEITIGNGTLIEESGIVDTQFHSLHPDRRDVEDETLEKCRIKIGSNVKIGARCFITKGVTIGDNTIIYPGSIVTQSLPTNTIAMGNPARPIKK